MRENINVCGEYDIIKKKLMSGITSKMEERNDGPLVKLMILNRCKGEWVSDEEQVLEMMLLADLMGCDIGVKYMNDFTNFVINRLEGEQVDEKFRSALLRVVQDRYAKTNS